MLDVAAVVVVVEAAAAVVVVAVVVVVEDDDDDDDDDVVEVGVVDDVIAVEVRIRPSPPDASLRERSAVEMAVQSLPNWASESLNFLISASDHWRSASPATSVGVLNCGDPLMRLAMRLKQAEQHLGSISALSFKSVVI